MKESVSCLLKDKLQMKDSSYTSMIFFHQEKLQIYSKLKILMVLSTTLDQQSKVKELSITRTIAGNSSLIESRKIFTCLYVSLQ